MKKRIIAFALTGILASSCLSACAANESSAKDATTGPEVVATANDTTQDPKKTTNFIDVKPGAWYEEGIEYVSQSGLMNGVGENRFAPDGTVTRGMLVTILYRMEGSPNETGRCSFEDVKQGGYYEKAVIWAADSEIVSGYSDKKFGPDDPVTREQVATILYRYSDYKEYGTSNRASLSKFSDAGSISQYAVDAMSWAVAEGLISGTDKGTLDPKGSATRAQLAAIIMRYDKSDKGPAQSKDNPKEETETTDPTKPENTEPQPSNGGQPTGGGTSSGGGEENPHIDAPVEEPIGTLPTIVVEKVTAKPGEKNVAVTVKVYNNPGILGMALSVLYDENVMTLTNGETGEAVKGILSMTKPGEFSPQCRFIWDGQEITPNETKDGTILTLQFDIKDSVPTGVYPITIFYNDKDIIDNDLNEISLKVKNGSILVEE